MKKRVLLLLLLATFLIPLTSAEINETLETKAVQQANLWLINQVDGKWNILSSDDISLALFALSYDDRLATEGKNTLLNKSKNRECWPSPTCKIKSTAFAVLALNRLGQNTDSAVSWLLERKAAYTSTGIRWFLQIDSEYETNCTINYDSKTYNLNVYKNKTYSWSGSTPTCLSLTNDNYWLEISKTCLDKSFDITCTKPSVVSLPYKHQDILYVPSESFPTSATVAIRTVCLKEGIACNYDSTLWAAYALKETGNDYSFLIPYLIDQKEENQKFMADAFLYLLTSKTEYAESLLAQQSKEGYWSDVGGFGKYYDTALAINALKDYSSDNITKAKEWLINEQKDGWGTTAKLRDTSLILSLVWPSVQRILPSNECQDVYDYVCRISCFEDEEQADYSCISGICCKPKGARVECKTSNDCIKRECRGEWITLITGIQKRCEYPEELTCDDNFDNDGDGKIDFNDNDCTETCSQKGGKICSLDEKCSEHIVKAFDTDECCLATCIPVKTCSEQKGFKCTAEQECKGVWLTASDTSYCCSEKCKSKTNILPFIIIIIILALAAGAFFLYKKGFFKKPIIKKSLFPTTLSSYKPQIRPLIQQPSQQIPSQAAIQSQPQPTKPLVRKETKELDETLKKLKKLAEEKK
ncbi:MAG: hypothetical protein QW041_00425 [Candidatus Pacearchaeota archaeon]